MARKYNLAGVKALTSHYEKPLPHYSRLLAITSMPNWLITFVSNCLHLSGKTRLAPRLAPALHSLNSVQTDELYLKR